MGNELGSPLVQFIGWFLAWLTLSGLLATLLLKSRSAQAISALLGAGAGAALMKWSGALRTYLWWILLVGLAVLVVGMICRPTNRARFASAFRILTGNADLGTLAEENERFKRIVQTLAESHRCKYRIRDRIDTTIESDGTSVLRRVLEPLPLSDSVSWVYLGAGTTVNNPGKKGVSLGQPRVVDGRGRKLDHCWYDESEKMKKMLVFLREPIVRGGKTQTVHSEQENRGTWMALIREHEDKGNYKTLNEVESVELTIHAPKELSIEDLTIDPAVGETRVSDDRSNVTWTAADLPAEALYKFTLRCLSK